jgi:hypothetical protein
LTLVVTLGYLDVVTQNVRPLARPRANLGTDEVIDEPKAWQNPIASPLFTKKPAG